MPVEIRELIIRTSVEQKRRESEDSSESAASCQEENTTNQASNQLAEMGKMIEEKNER